MTGQRVRIRPAELSGPDAATVGRLVGAYLRQTEREKVEQSGSSPASELPPRYRLEVDDPARAYADATVYLAEAGGAAVGVVVIQQLGDAREVKRLWADPLARGRGVGSALVDAALGERDVVVRLTVWDWRDDAIRLYRRHGFLAVPSWDPRPRLLCMEYRPVSP